MSPFLCRWFVVLYVQEVGDMDSIAAILFLVLVAAIFGGILCMILMTGIHLLLDAFITILEPLDRFVHRNDFAALSASSAPPQKRGRYLP